MNKWIIFSILVLSPFLLGVGLFLYPHIVVKITISVVFILVALLIVMLFYFIAEELGD
jgi:hypothetical protein